jgi:hypothetical protein
MRVICPDKHHSKFMENYIDRQNNTHIPLLANCLLLKRGSLYTREHRVLPLT